MPIAYYFDEHVPTAIRIGLRRRGIDVITVQDDHHDGSPDDIVLDRAGFLGRILYSQDKDFLIEAARRQAAQIFFTGVIFSKQSVSLIGKLIDDLEFFAFAAEPIDLECRVTHIPLP